MKLITFQDKGPARLGVLRGEDQIIDLQQADASLPNEITTFLSAGAEAFDTARQAVASAATTISLSAVTLLSPISRPGKIICIGLNYSDHAAESGLPIPQFPVVFAKYANAVIAHGDNIVLPRVTQQVDYEAELGFVIGKRGRYIPESEAMAYVGGYLAINDVSARDYQARTSQWTMGKTFDTFCPMGPTLTTADEIADPHNLRISLNIGGEVLQDSNTSNLIFSIPQLIASLSEVMTLEVGDVVSTGTPPGVGMARKPQRWLQAGDVVNVTIEGLGTLSNPVIAEQ